MKLVNPTDIQIIEAVAKEIAKWSPENALLLVGDFTDNSDMDLIMECLEKEMLWDTQWCRGAGIKYITRILCEGKPRYYVEGRDNSFSKSAAIALLKAHGILSKFDHERPT